MSVAIIISISGTNQIYHWNLSDLSVALIRSIIGINLIYQFCLFRVFALRLEWIMMGWINIRIILNVTQIEEMMSSLSVLIKNLYNKVFWCINVYVCQTAGPNWLIFLNYCIYRVSHETWQLVNILKCLLP